MGFNLNISTKPEYKLQENQIDELINTFGIKCKYLYTEKMNKDLTVFRDFSHLRVGEDFEYIYLMPEDTENWEGESQFNLFGAFNNFTQHLFISKKSMYKLFPDFLETGRKEILNSLIVTPSSTLLEITNIDNFIPGVNNLWGFSDQPSSYKLSVKVYDHNIADEGTREVKTGITLSEEAVYKDGTEVIHQSEVEIDTSDIDEFFSSLETTKENVKGEAKTGSTDSVNPGAGASNTHSPFGSYS